MGGGSSGQKQQNASSIGWPMTREPIGQKVAPNPSPMFGGGMILPGTTQNASANKGGGNDENFGGGTRNLPPFIMQ